MMLDEKVWYTDNNNLVTYLNLMKIEETNAEYDPKSKKSVFEFERTEELDEMIESYNGEDLLKAFIHQYMTTRNKCKEIKRKYEEKLEKKNK